MKCLQQIHNIKHKKALYIFIFWIGLFFDCQSQTIIWSDIQIDSISKIDKTNNSIINPIRYPNLSKNGLVLNVASTEYYDFQKEDFVKNAVKEYMDKKGIIDNGNQTKKFAIIKNGNEFLLNEFQTETRYYYDEGCGIIKNIAIVGGENILDQDIICIFDNNFRLKNNKLKIIKIEDNQSRYIQPKRKIDFSGELDSMEIIYKGSYCYESFEYDGTGTIIPLYVNVVLSIKDKATQNEEIIMQLPHNGFFNIKSISFTDINLDKHYDIILETEDELCIYRMIYLTERKNGLIQYNYIGKMEVYCDCP
jgi:hypothetical protein